MAKKLKVTRKRDSFYGEDGQLIQKFPSISQARRHSRLMQSAERWEVTVDKSADPKPAPKRDKGDAADRFIARRLREQMEERIREEQERKYGPNTLRLKKGASA